MKPSMGSESTNHSPTGTAWLAAYQANLQRAFCISQVCYFVLLAQQTVYVYYLYLNLPTMFCVANPTYIEET